VPALIAAPLFLARSSAHGCVAGRSSSTICEAPALARRRTSEPEVLASAFDVEDVLGERAERHEQPAVVGTAGRELSAEVLDNRTAHRTRAALLLELDDRGLEPERVPLGDDVHAGIPDTHGSATSPAASRSAAVPAGATASSSTYTFSISRSRSGRLHTTHSVKATPTTAHASATQFAARTG
jgi:hypothetical protein